MNVRNDLALAYMIGYDDATARRKPDSSRAGVLNSYNCPNSERTTTVDETWHVGFNMWNGERVTIHIMECSKCGRTYEHVNGNYEFCPRCGRKVVDE